MKLSDRGRERERKREKNGVKILTFHIFPNFNKNGLVKIYGLKRSLAAEKKKKEKKTEKGFLSEYTK